MEARVGIESMNQGLVDHFVDWFFFFHLRDSCVNRYHIGSKLCPRISDCE